MKRLNQRRVVNQTRLTHEVVEYVPERLDDGVLYVSYRYATVVHKCCCGCGEEVITPLGHTEWSIELEPAGVTLYPSIGNWSYACRSHYWIRRGRVLWAGEMTQREIEMGRAHDRTAKREHFASVNRRKALDRLLRAINPAALIRWLWSRFNR